jgi:hypothetical protein
LRNLRLGSAKQEHFPSTKGETTLIIFNEPEKTHRFHIFPAKNPIRCGMVGKIISRPFGILRARKMQEKYKYGLWGVAAGAIALALVGFTWGGWVTGSTAKMQADAAGWTALLPVCADAILANPAALAELKTKRTTDYDDVVRDHLKMVAGRADLSFAFRRDCGKTIEARMQPAAIKN